MRAVTRIRGLISSPLLKWEWRRRPWSAEASRPKKVIPTAPSKHVITWWLTTISNRRQTMSDELAHLEKDLLGQLRKMQDYLAALEAQNNELILQNNSLEAQNLTLRTAQNKIIERQFELTTQNDALKRQNQALLGQLNDAKTYQSDVMTQNKELMTQNKELMTQNKQLRESLKLSENQILKLTKQLSEVQDQPPTPSMTTH